MADDILKLKLLFCEALGILQRFRFNHVAPLTTGEMVQTGQQNSGNSQQSDILLEIQTGFIESHASFLFCEYVGHELTAL